MIYVELLEMTNLPDLDVAAWEKVQSKICICWSMSCRSAMQVRCCSTHSDKEITRNHGKKSKEL